jgi:hypothetical protein
MTLAQKPFANPLRKCLIPKERNQGLALPKNRCFRADACRAGCRLEHRKTDRRGLPGTKVKLKQMVNR